MAAAQILIHRSLRKETTIQNAIIWDKSLSNMARFALIAILSLPEDWDYSVRGMAVMLGVSKDTMGKYLRELETAGYLRRRQGGKNGKFAKAVYTITDTPGEFGDEAPPCPKNSDTAEAPPCPNFPDPKKSPQKNVKVLENNIPPKAPQGGRRCVNVPKWKPERFEAFWAYYREHARGEDRAGAVREWDRLKPDDELIRVMGYALQAQVQSEDWKRGIGIPYACRWLRNRRWEDTPPRPGKPPAEAPVTVEDRGLPVW